MVVRGWCAGEDGGKGRLRERVRRVVRKVEVRA